jgi:hypothetical protein
MQVTRFPPLLFDPGGLHRCHEPGSVLSQTVPQNAQWRSAGEGIAGGAECRAVDVRAGRRRSPPGAGGRSASSVRRLLYAGAPTGTEQ